MIKKVNSILFPKSRSPWLPMPLSFTWKLRLRRSATSNFYCASPDSTPRRLHFRNACLHPRHVHILAVLIASEHTTQQLCFSTRVVHIYRNPIQTPHSTNIGYAVSAGYNSYANPCSAGNRLQVETYATLQVLADGREMDKFQSV